METVRKVTGLINRPGGFTITDRAISFCGFQPEAKILDIGCGSGATVSYLIQNYGFEAYGIDKNLKPNYVQGNLTKAPAEAIPYPSASMDGVVMECSFSMMEDPLVVLTECSRVLKTDGRLVVSDIYARGEPAQLKGCLGRIDTKEDIIDRIERNGFIVELFEDFSHDLQTMWGQMIFEKGGKPFYCSLGVSADTLKHIKCGYYLIVAIKR